MTLFVSTKKLIYKTINGENVTSLEVIKVVLVKCNLVDNHDKHIFTPKKTYVSNIEPSNLEFLRIYNTQLDESDNIESNIYISKWYTIRNKRQS